MNPHDGLLTDAGPASRAAAMTIADPRTTRVGFGGERRSSQSEAWASRNRLHLASIARDEAARQDADSVTSCERRYRVVCSCELELDDEAH